MEKGIKDKIINTYARIKQLRDKGIKMKDISEMTQVTSSALSALYSSVIPAFMEQIQNSINEDTALDYALQTVNNISKKRFFEMLETIETKLHHAEFKTRNANREEQPFFDDIEREAIAFMAQTANYSGTYMAYSRSSYKDALKAEPYLVCNIEKGNIMPHVIFSNEMGQEYQGTALFSAHQMGYIFINEQKNRKLGLRAISLQLPLFDNPKVLKGIYLSHDYNHNPIARRIVFIKQTSDTLLDNFRALKARVISPENLTDEEKGYYDYTCCEGDYISSFMYASPEPNQEDLIKEKLMLKIKL